MKQQTIRICFARDDSENWIIANPILKAGEPGYEINTGYFKIGNGINCWNELPYANKNSFDTNDSSFNSLQNKLNQLERENAIDKWRINILENNIQLPWLHNDIELEGMLLKGGEAAVEDYIECEKLLTVNKSIILHFNPYNLSLQNPFLFEVNDSSRISFNEVTCQKELAIINNGNLLIDLGNIVSFNKNIIKVNNGKLELSDTRLKVDDVIGDAEGYDKTIDVEENGLVIIHENCQFYKFNPTDNPRITIAEGVELIHEGDWYKTIEQLPTEENPNEVPVQG